MRNGAAHLLGVVSLGVNAVFRPGFVVRWLSRRFPEVFFQRPEAGPMVATIFGRRTAVTVAVGAVRPMSGS